MSEWSDKIEAEVKAYEALVYVTYAQVTDALTHGMHREATVCSAGVPPGAVLVRVADDPDSRTIALIFRDPLFRADLLEVRFAPAPKTTITYETVARRELATDRRMRRAAQPPRSWLRRITGRS